MLAEVLATFREKYLRLAKNMATFEKHFGGVLTSVDDAISKPDQ